MDMKKNPSVSEEELKVLEQQGGFHFEPCETAFDFEDEKRFVPLSMSADNLMHMSAFLQQMPVMAAAGMMGKDCPTR